MNDGHADQTDEITDEDLLEEGEHHIWDKTKASSIPLVLLGVGFFVMIILFIVFLSKMSDMASQTKIDSMEKRLARLEEKLGKITEIDEKMILLETQGKKFDLFVDRFD
ncbi:MAG: hypothetical protein KJO26_07520, partial [Deltaproteobacteria bacterium]|nr:hypothetical protein [Deltaproteobacteria bacterium]